MNIDNLVIEVTRKCNMKCEHCLRGTAQNKCIDRASIYHTFRKIDYIGTLTISGGEPSLAVEQIEMIIENMIYSQCEVGNFYIVTNAKYLTTRFFEALEELYRLCTDNEVSQIQYSSDRFHYNQKHIKRLERYFNDNEERYFECGCWDSLVSPKGNIHNVLRQGKAKDWGTQENCEGNFLGSEYDGKISLQEAELYINVNGDIIKGCNWSYKNQEKQKIGNIKNMSCDNIINELNNRNMIEWEEEKQLVGV